MKYISPLDPHTHLRGSEYNEPYLEWGLSDARAVGLAGVFEMPNPKPWLIDEDSVAVRIHQTDSLGPYVFHGIQGPHVVSHGIHVGLTNSLDQARAALKLIMEKRFGKRVVADKIFYTHSTGNMGILDEDYQKTLWDHKCMLGYKGVSIGHFEDENYYTGEFDFANPLTHSQHQNELAELVQVERQFRNAVDAKFQGTFYVAHISNPDTIDWLDKRKGRYGFRVVKEVTWHHMFLNTYDYVKQKNRVKMNPPLRNKDRQEKLLMHVLNGKVDVIATDHAPHPVARKDSDKPPSGIPGIAFWPKGIELLRQAEIDEELLARITFHNANDIFGTGLEPNEVEVEYNEDLWTKYGFNPFCRIA